MKAHIKAEIQTGDRHDVLLRQFFGGANWQLKDPQFCHREWQKAPFLAHLLQSMELESMSLATDIWTCRVHLEQRWPGWTIHNDQTREGRKCHSRYRLMTTAEVAEFEAEKRSRKRAASKGQDAARRDPGAGSGAMVCVTSHINDTAARATEPPLAPNLRVGAYRQTTLAFGGGRP